VSEDLKRVGTEDEFEDTDRLLVEIEGIEIGVFRVDGEYHAITNYCPHQNGPLAEGGIQRQVVADIPPEGERPVREWDDETTVIRCPLHSYGFDIETGENVADPDLPTVPTWDVVVEDGVVYIAP
jgi:nitrite reductase/ring-hydroxylating ferredoxin subunit